MRKWFIAAAALVIIVGIPAAYAAAPDNTPKQTSAQAQSGDDGAAAKACNAERKSIGVEAFNRKYGTNKNFKNAFGKCVSSKSKDDKENDDDKGEPSGAAKTCKAERASMGSEAFAKKYGTNHNLKNAFGKCVSGKSKSKDKD